METILAIIGGGFLLGLAGSLHCACMCGGIASGALFMLQPATPIARLSAFALLQAGRIATYAMAGGTVAYLTSAAINPAATAGTFRVLQWAGAIALMWIGFSTAGMLPGLSRSRGGALAVSLPAAFEPILAPLRRSPRLAPVAMGLGWGLTPCPMVYAALFSAALTGSFAHGVLWMLSFGVGTLPGVSGAVLGVSLVSKVRGSPAAEAAAGLLIAAFGFSTLYFGWPLSSLFCATR